ncbi:unnamed protein product [Darwinula stevensoni]|uniref:Protein YIPF n=1 Tax=Darwinula stevensoni TaxID=69355 RepID=A0A7R9A4E5_9CRUS|nr:unnamed protein product [Darwinula stevensoni]CAG0884116.1 unnamed protein product [Darwinula stevensoni]
MTAFSLPFKPIILKPLALRREQAKLLYSGVRAVVASSGMYMERPVVEFLRRWQNEQEVMTLAVLNPMKQTKPEILQDTDLAGPLAFCLALGAFLLLNGKVHFGYIYGIGVVGCLGMYFLLNMMSMDGVSIGVTVSVLGYCLLPMVGVSGLAVIFTLKGGIGLVATLLSVFWCSWSASKLFVTALAMDHQQPLVAYPCALLYGVFALLSVF